MKSARLIGRILFLAISLCVGCHSRAHQEQKSKSVPNVDWVSVKRIIEIHNVSFDSLVPSMEPPGEISHFYLSLGNPPRKQIYFRLENPLILPEVIKKDSMKAVWIESKVLELSAVQVEIADID